MTREDQILALLWPPDFAWRGTAIYAVLDGARDRRVHRMVRSSELPWRCLYAGAIPDELLEVAPYLVHVRPGGRLTSEVIAAGWGQAWGIWLVSPAPFDEIQRHLRRLLRVRDERGRRLLFRYYDPVVLSAFLPTCTVAELAELYGPIDAFLVEAGAGSGVTEYRFDGAALHERTRAAGPAAAIAGEVPC